MDILSALSGKIYQFNKLNTPINQRILSNTKDLPDEMEKFACFLFFKTASDVVLHLFNPDDGILKNQTKIIRGENLKQIYVLIMSWCFNAFTEEVKSINTKELQVQFNKILDLEKVSLGLPQEILKKDKPTDETLLLWVLIQKQTMFSGDHTDFEKFLTLLTKTFENNWETLVKK